jgi:RNA ligase (TIGR02306 family)
MRNLSSIKTVNEIRAIEGADRIWAYRVDGWWVVDQKEKYNIGDLVVYFEIDSVLPISSEFEFLRKNSYVKKDWLVSTENPTGEGFRLRTIKLRKQISQGLIIPIPVDFPYYKITNGNVVTIEDYEELDLTDYFGVVKWDPPVPATLSGKVKGNFPSFIPKTDQERVQNLRTKDIIPYINDMFEVTIKLDGSSMTFYHNNGKIGLCSRNLELEWENDQSTTFAQTFINMNIVSVLPELGNIAIQGELMGPGIQGNRENLKTHKFFVFDVYDIDTGSYYDSEKRQALVEALRSNGVNIDHCPVLEPMNALRSTIDYLLNFAEGKSINNEVREGLVFKSIQNPNFSFKAISNQFLLKTEG